MSIKYQRAIIEVEKKLAFMYVPAKAQEYMPAKTGKFPVLLEGERASTLLSYNVDHKRIFGLTAWYKKFKIEVGTVLNIELSKQLMKISIADNPSTKIVEVQPDEEDDEKTVDLSGLSSIEKGNIVEDRIKELILLYGQGLLNVYKPVIDRKGIDLIVMRDGVFMPIYLQIKSRFNTAKTGKILVDVNASTFNVHHSFYVIVAAYNTSLLELDERILLVPSKDYNENCSIVNVKGKPKKRLTVSVKENSKAKGVKYFINKSELANALFEKFEEMEKYIK